MSVLLIALSAAIVTHGAVARALGAGLSPRAVAARAQYAGAGSPPTGGARRRAACAPSSARGRGRARGRAPARRRAPPRGASAANSPTTVGPEPLTSARSAPAARACVERRGDLRGRARRAARCEVVVQQLARRRHQRRPRRRPRPRAPERIRRSRSSRAARARPSRSASRVHGGGRELRRRLAARAAPSGALGAGQRVQPLARARREPAPRAHLRGHVRAELAPRARAAAARRPAPDSVAGPGAAQPRHRPSRPPSPPATGSRLSIVSRSGGASQPVRRAKRAQRRQAQVLARRPGHARTDEPRPRARVRAAPSSSVELVGQRDRLHHARRARAGRRRAAGPTNRPRLTFAGALARAGSRGQEEDEERGGAFASHGAGRWPYASAAARARESPPAPGARRARRADGRAARARRAPRRASIAPLAPPPARASRRASCGGARRRPRRARAARRPRRATRAAAERGRAAAHQHEHGVDVRHRVKHGARHRPHDLDLARELGEHRRRAVGAAAGRRREALADLALDHRHPARARPAAPRSCAAARPRRSRRAGWRRPCRAPGAARARSTRIASPQCTVTFACGSVASCSASRRRSSTSTTCTCATRDGEVLGQHAEAAADLEHHVRAARARRRARSRRGCSSRRGSSGRARDRAGCRNRRRRRSVGWTGSRARGSLIPSRARAPRCAARSRPAPAPSTPRSRAMNAAVWATNAGWFRCLRTAWGVR